MDSLRYLTIEEMYELSDAILEKDMYEIKNELGDLLLHIVFYSRIASETNDFDITDVMFKGGRKRRISQTQQPMTWWRSDGVVLPVQKVAASSPSLATSL